MQVRVIYIYIYIYIYILLLLLLLYIIASSGTCSCARQEFKFRQHDVVGSISTLGKTLIYRFLKASVHLKIEP